MTILEKFFFGNVNPSEYEPKKDVKQHIDKITKLTEKLDSILSTEQQKEILEQIISCQITVVALSERDAFINGYILGTKMTTEVYRNQ